MADTSALSKVLQAAEGAVQAAGTAPDAQVTMGQAVVASAPQQVPVPDPTLMEDDPTEVKPTWYWIKDARGYGSVTTTLVFVAFWITTVSYILSMFDRVGPLSIRPFDVAACSSYFIPLITLYFGRKATEAWKETQTKK